MFGWGSVYQWSCDDPSITSWSDQLVGELKFPQISFSANISTPKDSGSFILVNLANISHQVGLRILCRLCFVSCV